MTAIYALELLIGKVFKMASQRAYKVMETAVKAETEKKTVKKVNPFAKAKSEPIPEIPKKSELASKYPRLADIYHKLEKQNAAIYEREQQLASVEKELAGAKGIFKAKQRKKLQEQAEPDSMKARSQRKQQEVKEWENNRQSCQYKTDRGGR